MRLGKKSRGGTTQEFAIHLNVAPRSGTLFLATDNGDNPAIKVRDFRGHYPVSRVVFTAASDSTQPIWIYYGNPDAASPRYDVALIADQLLRAERAPATLGHPENMHSKTERIIRTLSGSSLYIFWGVLAIVVIALPVTNLSLASQNGIKANLSLLQYLRKLGAI
jgi:hypothetical protein